MSNPSPASDVPGQAPPDERVDPSPPFWIRFWGVRGNIPTPGPETVRYGGNTACVEVRAGDQHLIFDGGTGLRALGKRLAQQETTVNAHLFFTHTHWDRIQGFPFFCPAFNPATQLHIYGAAAPNGASIKQCLMDQMLRPNFFKPLQAMQAQMTFCHIQPGQILELGEVVVETLSLNRHTSALGYRVSWRDKSFVYASDTDPHREQADPNLIFLATGADVLIFDGTYVDMAYADPQSRHSIPWELGVEVAQASGVKHLVLFHHNPCHDDTALDALEQRIQEVFPLAVIAQEGMVINLLP